MHISRRLCVCTLVGLVALPACQRTTAPSHHEVVDVEVSPTASTPAQVHAAASGADIPPPAPLLEAATVAKLREATYLVWGRDAPNADAWRREAARQKRDGWVVDWEHDVARGRPSVTYALAADGAVVTSVPRAVLAADGDLFAWDVREIPVPRVGCKALDEDVVAYGDDEDLARRRDEARAEARDLAREPTIEVDEASLVDLAHGARRVVASCVEKVRGALDFECEATLTATCGAVAFVRRDSHIDMCGGAHGSEDFDIDVVDVAAAAEPRPAAEAWLVPAALARVRRAASPVIERLDGLAREAKYRDHPDHGELSLLDISDVRPSYDPSGRLHLEVRVVKPTAYAFTFSNRSYSIETLVPLSGPEEITTPMRATFASCTTPPEKVAAFLRSHPAFVMGGYTALPRAEDGAAP